MIRAEVIARRRYRQQRAFLVEIRLREHLFSVAVC